MHGFYIQNKRKDYDGVHVTFTNTKYGSREILKANYDTVNYKLMRYVVFELLRR